MPIYEFKCSSCDLVTESIVSYTVNTISCPSCSNEARKIFSASVGIVSGGTPRFSRVSKDKNVSS